MVDTDGDLLAASALLFDTDSVRQCYYLIARKEYRPEPLVLHNPPVMNYNPNLTAYDSLMGGEQHG